MKEKNGEIRYLSSIGHSSYGPTTGQAKARKKNSIQLSYVTGTQVPELSTAASRVHEHGAGIRNGAGTPTPNTLTWDMGAANQVLTTVPNPGPIQEILAISF